jgi:hypothetical protein
MNSMSWAVGLIMVVLFIEYFAFLIAASVVLMMLWFLVILVLGWAGGKENKIAK